MASFQQATIVSSIFGSAEAAQISIYSGMSVERA
jgi:hypothetical protein